MDADPDRDPKQEKHLIKNHHKISKLIILRLKQRWSNIFFYKYRYALKYHDNAFFYCWHRESDNIYGRIRNWIRNFLLVKKDPDPDPKLGRKWDLNPDPKKMDSEPQHWPDQKLFYESG
jgi:hypothetical protein